MEVKNQRANHLVKDNGKLDQAAGSPGRAISGVGAFLVDYCQRHAHPVNAILHIFGVPAAFAGFFYLFTKRPVLGGSLVFLGYLLQYLGHRAQKNEVGEVTLIKHLWQKLIQRGV